MASRNDGGMGGSSTSASDGGGAGTKAIVVVASKSHINAPKNRDDPGWKHYVSIDGETRLIRCKYCEKEIKNGIYRSKHHLAGTGKDVEPCRAVPDDVQKQMWKLVYVLQDKLIKKTKLTEAAEEEEMEEARGGKRNNSEAENPGQIFKRRAGSSNQPTINSVMKKPLREETCLAIASFFYNNVIPFNVAKSDEFKNMLQLVSLHGIGFNPPSYHEIRMKYLKKQVAATKEALEKHKSSWKTTGCTIMTDGWTDRRRRTILNFLVNSPMGTIFLKSVDASSISKTADKVFMMMDEIVEEVGEEHVAQIVTDNATNYLMEKRKKLYWTPCAAHCIDLMLEDLEKKLPIH